MQPQYVPDGYTQLHCHLCGRWSPTLYRAYRLRSVNAKVRLFCPGCMSLLDRKRLDRSFTRGQCKHREQHQHQHSKKPFRGQHMPKHTHHLPSRALPDLSFVKVMSEEQRIAVCQTSVRQIYDMLRASPAQWRSFLTLARSVMAHIDATTFIRQPHRTAEQAWLIAGLQRLAFADADNGAVQDIAEWCNRQWLTIYQRDPTNVTVLRGIGHAWLSRAQPALSRIHRSDGSGSSSSGSQRSGPALSSEQEATVVAQQSAEAERRAGTADYVEARGYLMPATEYLERAVSSAMARRELSGDLLATAAEAYMSLGNASSPRVNEAHFRRAIEMLRAAAAIPGYTLSRYLQQYLDDFGRVVE